MSERASNSATLAQDLWGERVRIRLWQNSRDDARQQAWPQHTDPFNQLWNIPRTRSNGAFALGGDIGQRRVWAVEDQQGRLIGRISLRDIERRVGRARLGISLGAPFVSQGLGTEALGLFLNFFFGALKFCTMVLDVAACNRRAVRCYENLGFRSVADEWRRSHADACLRLLDDPAYDHLRSYFRRERHNLWVQFLEMELQRDEWFRLYRPLQAWPVRLAGPPGQH